MAQTEQLEYVCPRCRKRTIVSQSRSGGDDEVYCPKCEVAMQPHEVSTPSAAAAASPSRPSTKSATGKTAAKTAAKTKATGKTSSRAKTRPASGVTVTKTPEPAAALVGDFRCACCGYSQTVLPGEKKLTVLRCPTCFVKLEKVK